MYKRIEMLITIYGLLFLANILIGKYLKDMNNIMNLKQH